MGEIEEERNIWKRDKKRKQTKIVEKETHEFPITGHLSFIECNNVYFYGVNLRDSLIVFISQHHQHKSHTPRHNLIHKKVLDVVKTCNAMTAINKSITLRQYFVATHFANESVYALFCVSIYARIYFVECT